MKIAGFWNKVPMRVIHNLVDMRDRTCVHMFHACNLSSLYEKLQKGTMTTSVKLVVVCTAQPHNHMSAQHLGQFWYSLEPTEHLLGTAKLHANSSDSPGPGHMAVPL
jgi:hypothetical protein